MSDVLFVSKSIAPPWNDSGKNLVRDLARGMTRHRPTLMVGGQDPGIPHARLARVYEAGVGFAPGLSDQVRVFTHLLGSRGFALWHFFFAPNPRSLLAGALATKLRRKRSLHTISSAPRDVRKVVPLLFADCHVVLSEHTRRRFLEAGLSEQRVRRIPPAIEPLVPIGDLRRVAVRQQLGLTAAPCIVFPGDLEFGEGALLVLEAMRALPHDLQLVLACRAKTPAAREAERTVRERAARLSQRVLFFGETPRIHELLAVADVVVLPSRDLYAKMDYPLVLLEAMSLARSVIVAEGSAAEELASEGGALSVPVDAAALASELARLLGDDDARARLGAAARASVLARYGHERMAAAYEQLYDTLL